MVGKIPASLGEISNLEQLDLANNNLSGTILEDLSGLSMLASLDVSYNRLYGIIPLGTHFGTFNDNLFQRNKCLCGFPLPTCKQKENPAKKSTVGSVNSGWLSSVDKHVSIIALGLGLGIGFGGVMAVMLFWNKARNWMIPSKTVSFYGLYKFPK